MSADSTKKCPLQYTLAPPIAPPTTPVVIKVNYSPREWKQQRSIVMNNSITTRHNSNCYTECTFISMQILIGDLYMIHDNIIAIWCRLLYRIFFFFFTNRVACVLVHDEIPREWNEQLCYWQCLYDSNTVHGSQYHSVVHTCSLYN